MKLETNSPLLLTRSLRDAPCFSNLLRRYKWRVIGCRAIQIVEEADLTHLDFLSGYYDWIIFNSRYSVQILFGLLEKEGLLDFFVETKKIFAVGPETAKVVRSYGVEVDLMPHVYAAAGVVEAFKRNGITQQQVLLTAGDQSDSWLTKQLDALGNQCTMVEVYKNQAPKSLPSYIYQTLSSGDVSCLAVTSPSAVLNLLSMTQLRPHRENILEIPVASIGPTTSKACGSLGFNVIAESETHTLRGLAETILGLKN